MADLFYIYITQEDDKKRYDEVVWLGNAAIGDKTIDLRKFLNFLLSL